MNFYLTIIKDYLRRNILSIMIIIIELVNLFLIFYNIFYKREDTTIIESDLLVEEKEEVTTENKEAKVYVDIKGYVTNPGVYEVDSNSLVNDCITLAGGLLSNADTSNINLSMQVSNEMVIYIPKKGETTTINNDASISKSNTSSSSTSKSKVININTATKEELTTLSGIGNSKAQNILDYRNKNGNFKTIEDIKKVSGIGDSIYAKIKDYITV